MPGIKAVGIAIAVFAMSLGAHTAADAQISPDGAKCERIKKSIRRIESRMRTGYTAKQGVRLAERLRTLRLERSKACR